MGDHPVSLSKVSLSNSLVNRLNNLLFPLAEFAGMVQFGYSTERDELIALPRHAIQTVFFCIVYASVIFYDVTSDESISVAGEKSTLFNNGMQFVTSVSFAFSFCTVLYTYIIRKRVGLMIKTFLAVDREMTDCGIEIDSRKMLFYFRVFVGVGIGLSVVVTSWIAWNVFYFTKASVLKQVVFVAAVSHLNFTYAIETFIFNGYFCDIYLKFKTLNECLSNHFVTPINPSNALSAAQRRVMLARIARFHDLTCKAKDLVIGDFKLQLIVYLVSVMVVTVFCVLCTLLGVSENDRQLSHISIAFSFMSEYLNGLVLITFTTATTSASAGKYTGVMAHKAINCCTDSGEQLQLEMLSMQVLHSTPEVSLGLFVMNWPLAFSYVSTGFSYVVILIQFQYFINGRHLD